MAASFSFGAVSLQSSSGEAQTIAKTVFSNGNAVSTLAAGQSGGGGPVSAISQIGNGISVVPPITPGQSFSVANTVSSLPLTLAFGSMGAGYGGPGVAVTYQQSVSFTFNTLGGPLLIDFMGSNALGNGFDSALLQIFFNGSLFESHAFDDLSIAEAFFSSDLLALNLAAGINTVDVVFNESMSTGDGFSFNYAVAGAVAAVPELSTWAMIILGFCGLGSFAYCRRGRVVICVA